MLAVETGYQQGFTTVKAAGGSAINGTYTEWLCSGFDMVKSPLAEKNDIKAPKILDKTKLESLKGNNWYDCKEGDNEFDYKLVVETSKTTEEEAKARELNLGFKTPVVGFSSKVTSTHNTTRTNNKCYGAIVACCLLEKCTTSISTRDLQKCLSDEFVQDVKSGNYNYVFERYGTHLVKQAYFGGKLEVMFETKETTNKTTSEIKALAEASYKGLTAGASTTTTKSFEEFKQSCDFRMRGIGGDLSYLPSNFDQSNNYTNWASSVPNRMGMYQVNNCIPIWDLFSDTNTKTKLQIAYYKYLNSHLQEQRDNIKFVTSMRVAIRNNSRVDEEVRVGESVARRAESSNNEYSDLNRKAGGKYIYLLYTKGLNASSKVTDVIEDCRTSGTSTAVKPGYIFVNGDLNAGAGGRYIYLNYKVTPNDKSCGYQEFCTRTSAYDKGDGWVPIKDMNGNPIDLNRKSGGDYIYLFGYKDSYFAKIDSFMAENQAKIRQLEASIIPSTSPTPRVTASPVITAKPTLKPIRTLRPIKSLVPVKTLLPYR